MKSHIRFLSRNKLYTAIMAAGLSVAFGFIIIMSCYVWQSYVIARSVPDYEQKYVFSNEKGYSLATDGQVLKDRIPEIMETTRLSYGFSNVITLEGWDMDLPAGNFYLADENIFEMLPVKFIAGDGGCLKGGSKVAVCKEFADTHGGLDILGKIMTFNDISYTVTGIYEDLQNTCLMNMQYILSIRDEDPVHYVSTVIRLGKDADPNLVNEKIQDTMDDYWKDQQNYYWRIGETKSHLTNISEIYYSDLAGYFKRGSREVTIMFSLIVLLVLISAIFNFINLQSALAGKRMNEMAARLSLGEQKSELAGRTLVELFSFVCICFFFGALISLVLEPYMNELLAAEVKIKVSFDFQHILFYMALVAMVTLIVFISSSLQIVRINPIAVIKKEFRFRRKMTTARIFIGLQTLQAVMMTATVIVMQKQLDHMLDMPIGVDPKGVFLSTSNGPIFEQTLKALPYVESIGRSTGQPGDMYSSSWGEHKFGTMYCEPEVLKIFGLKITRDFNPDSDSGLWMSDSAYGYYSSLEDDARSMFISAMGRGAELAGTYEDFATQSAIYYHNISRMSLINVSNDYGISHKMYIKTIGNPEQIRRRLMEDGEKYCRDNNLEYGIYLSSYEERIERDFEGMKRQIKFISVFMYVAIFLSILGLIGISRYYVMEQRTGIAIRKVFGATIRSEVIRNLKIYAATTAVATVTGLVPAVFIAIKYLEQYAYRMELSPWIFIFTALITMTISIAAVFGQILSAAKVNPIEVLKKE